MERGASLRYDVWTGATTGRRTSLWHPHMPTPRILIIDEKAATRQWLSKIIKEDVRLENVGAVPVGPLAVEKAESVSPELVVMGVGEEPEPALDTLGAIHKSRPRLPILIVSPRTWKGAPLAIDVLSRGAAGYVTSPVQPASPTALEAFREALLEKIQTLLATRTPKDPPPQVATRPRSVNPPCDVVAIGVSTGGPNVLADLIPQLPADFPTPILIVQHMPASFLNSLAKRLDANCPIGVRHASEGDPLRPGTVYIAPGDRHMVVDQTATGRRIALNDDPPENSCRPSADVLFRSVARTFGGRSLAVVLTGMGSDGTRGCREIHAAGGQVIVQDAATSVVWGMPGQVVDAGLADEVLPIDQIAGAIVRRVRRGTPSGLEK